MNIENIPGSEGWDDADSQNLVKDVVYWWVGSW